jgi:hypothetical protein
VYGLNSDDTAIMRTIPYVYTVNKDIDYIALYDISQVIEGAPNINMPIVFTKELEHDDEGYLYEGFVGSIEQGGFFCKLRTPVEYTKSDTVIVEAPTGSVDSDTVTLQITVETNKELTMPNEIKEFVFNLKSPANIVLSHPVSWNNDNTPDFTQTGTYTLSILNGVGCYTFI